MHAVAASFQAQQIVGKLIALNVVDLACSN
jgi:hypothetical protein